MFKKLSVREVSGEQREFAERTANEITCRADCRAECVYVIFPPEYQIEVYLPVLNYQISVGSCN